MSLTRPPAVEKGTISWPNSVVSFNRDPTGSAGGWNGVEGRFPRSPHPQAGTRSRLNEPVSTARSIERWQQAWETKLPEQLHKLNRRAWMLARIIHGPTLTRSVSEGGDATCPRLRFGLVSDTRSENTRGQE